MCRILTRSPLVGLDSHSCDPHEFLGNIIFMCRSMYDNRQHKILFLFYNLLIRLAVRGVLLKSTNNSCVMGWIFLFSRYTGSVPPGIGVRVCERIISKKGTSDKVQIPMGIQTLLYSVDREKNLDVYTRTRERAVRVRWLDKKYMLSVVVRL